MKPKHLTLILLFFSLVGIGVGYFLKNSIEVGLCLVSEPTCINQLTQIGNALFYSMQAVALVFLLLFFVPQAFGAWKKFAIWYLPIMFIYFAIYENSGFFSIPEEQVYRFFSIVYAVVSIVIIALISARKKA